MTNRSKSSSNPKRLRSMLMRHVVAFVCLSIYMAFAAFMGFRDEGTLSNLTVVFFLGKCLVAYGIGYFLYTPVHRAWVDSKG